MLRIAKPIVIFLVMVAMLSLPATSLASENVKNIKIPIADIFYFGHCGSEGGELVSFEGRVNMVVREDVYTPGGVHQNYHTNWMRVQGTGLTTGRRYVVTEVFNLQTNGSQGAWEYTYSTGLKIISQGSGDNYIAHNTIHLIWGPDGEVRADFAFISAECQG
jgi:hypothetical protein